MPRKPTRASRAKAGCESRKGAIVDGGSGLLLGVHVQPHKLVRRLRGGSEGHVPFGLLRSGSLPSSTAPRIFFAFRRAWSGVIGSCVPSLIRRERHMRWTKLRQRDIHLCVSKATQPRQSPKACHPTGTRKRSAPWTGICNASTALFVMRFEPIAPPFRRSGKHSGKQSSCHSQNKSGNARSGPKPNKYSEVATSRKLGE